MSILILILVVVVLLALALFAVQKTPIPSPLNWIIQVVLIVLAIIGIAMGLTGSVTAIAEWAGEGVVLGMMAGVGLILAEVAFTMYLSQKITAGVSILTAAISICDQLGLFSVAEGCESEDDLRQITALGYKATQGYYFSPPLPEEALLAYLEAAKNRRAPTAAESRAR